MMSRMTSEDRRQLENTPGRTDEGLKTGYGCGMHRFHRLIQILVGRPRLWTAIALGALTWALLPATFSDHAGTRYLMAWNVCAFTYLGFAVHMMRTSDADHITRRALKQHEGRFMVLAMVMTGAVSVLVAITSQLLSIKDVSYIVKVWHVALTVITVLSTWLFTHTLFAMHYAHDFYMARANQQPTPLQFPGEDQPDYGDFMYAACIIGTSGQTADVSFASRAVRRVCLLHCTFAFFFNTTILALTINIAAGLF
jgi:uncharacterized membrane protein